MLYGEFGRILEWIEQRRLAENTQSPGAFASGLCGITYFFWLREGDTTEADIHYRPGYDRTFTLFLKRHIAIGTSVPYHSAFRPRFPWMPDVFADGYHAGDKLRGAQETRESWLSKFSNVATYPMIIYPRPQSQSTFRPRHVENPASLAYPAALLASEHHL
ncbi:hypothetical protein J2W40_003747 [Sphingobium xenophagum]|uniref:Uncharacterized protein n=1 Tax=Sphingobium xenophagum TaxID=121428 RepID=A0ABU1X6Z4_SPHXE|nr:hypothetical protein [Sphingobium xenophagum]MDR7156901.1 hypothetical protein [Sphingobium xenophagum]